jgi:hypothetical protein
MTRRMNRGRWKRRRSHRSIDRLHPPVNHLRTQRIAHSPHHHPHLIVTQATPCLYSHSRQQRRLPDPACCSSGSDQGITTEFLHMRGVDADDRAAAVEQRYSCSVQLNLRRDRSARLQRSRCRLQRGITNHKRAQADALPELQRTPHCHLCPGAQRAPSRSRARLQPSPQHHRGALALRGGSARLSPWSQTAHTRRPRRRPVGPLQTG